MNDVEILINHVTCSEYEGFPRIPKMGAIAFSRKSEHSVVYAGWVLRQIMDDTATQHPEDSEMHEAFQAAKDIDGLIVYLLPPELASRITVAIRDVATGILSGATHSGVSERHQGDERTMAQYREALHGILEAIPPPNPDPPLSLPGAEETFSKFLASQGYPSAICWVFPGDMVVDKERRYWIKPNRFEATRNAEQTYQEGLERGLGVWLRAICSNETETFASVVVPENDLDAQYKLMGRCLKLSCPVERGLTFTATNRLLWLVLWLANGRRSRGLWL